MTKVPIAYRARARLGDVLRNKIRRGREAFLTAAAQDCRGTQRAVLDRLLALNQGSEFSRQHSLRPGMSLQEFRSRVPVADYEYVRPWIDRLRAGEHGAMLGRRNRLLMFAITSGTTAESKFIPVTRQFLDDYRAGWQRWGIGMYDLFPQLRELNFVQMTSSHRKSITDGGTPCGSISGLVASMQNAVVRSLYTVPAPVGELDQGELKTRMVLALAVADPWVGVLITANPSSVLQLLSGLQENPERVIRDVHDGMSDLVDLPGAPGRRLRQRLRGNRQRASRLEQILREHGALNPRNVWPSLSAMAVWTGGSASAYLRRLREICGGITVFDHGLHASEGRMTLPLEANCSSGVLELTSHFFEFIPAREADSDQPVVLTADELEVGEEYSILLTTSSGLYRYDIRDVVRCTGHHGRTPLLEFLHKGAHMSSITGEKLAESHIVSAVRTAEEEVGPCISQFTLTPEWGDKPGYVLYVEPVGESRNSTDIRRFSDAVERNLCSCNEEYREKRGSGRLHGLQVKQLPSSAWQQLRLNRLRSSGGSEEQYKHPCLVPDPGFGGLFLKSCGLVVEPGDLQNQQSAACS